MGKKGQKAAYLLKLNLPYCQPSNPQEFEKIFKLVVLNKGCFSPQGTLGNIWTHLVCPNWRGLCCRHQVGEKPGIPLNILQCPRQPPQQRINYPASNVNHVTAEKL